MKTKTNALAGNRAGDRFHGRARRAARSRRNRAVAEAQRTVSGDQVHQRHRYAHRRRVRSRDGAKRRLRRWRWPALPVRAPLRHAYPSRISPPPSSPTSDETPAEARQVNFATLPLQDAVKMVKGDGSRLLAVFSDPRCPYCKALDEELAKLDNVTVYTFLLPWLGPESRPVAEALWADAVPDRANDTTVLDRNLKLASQLGLRGTPMLIASDGRVSEGARSAEALDAWLTLQTSRSSFSHERQQGAAMNRIPTHSSFVAVVIACAVVSGCASMAGVGGTSEYSCKAPEGVKCDSVSGTYYNSVENNLPSQRQGGRATPQDEAAPTRMEALAGKRSVASAVYVTPALGPFGYGLWGGASSSRLYLHAAAFAGPCAAPLGEALGGCRRRSHGPALRLCAGR